MMLADAGRTHILLGPFSTIFLQGKEISLYTVYSGVDGGRWLHAGSDKSRSELTCGGRGRHCVVQAPRHQTALVGAVKEYFYPAALCQLVRRLPGVMV